jgi:hypothetical protein
VPSKSVRQVQIGDAVGTHGIAPDPGSGQAEQQYDQDSQLLKALVGVVAAEVGLLHRRTNLSLANGCYQQSTDL